MLSPKDFVPKSSKAASIYSFDSGYGTSAVEDDGPLHARTNDILDVVTQAATDSIQRFPQPSLTTEQVFTQFSSDPIGLGISNFWDVRVEDQLRLSRPESPADPVITKFNAFPSSSPAIADDDTACITCQLWDITNPGQGLKCDDCNNKLHIRPELLHHFDTKPNPKLPAPRLIIPQGSSSTHGDSKPNKARCSACEVACAIGPESSSTCPTCIPDPDLLSPISPSIVKRSCARRTNKLSAHASDHLQAWLKANQEDPYPNAETKRTLAQECGITEKQVTTWFTNTRARKLAKRSGRAHSSSDDEGAYDSDHSNITNTPIFTTSPTFGCDTPYSFASTSNESTPAALQTSRRGKKKNYRRMHTASPTEGPATPQTPVTSSPNLNGAEQETWQCTFCLKKLVPKSWRRHEETQHRPKYQWTCLATGPLVTSSRPGIAPFCAFCQMKNPSDDHFSSSHRIRECAGKCESERTFGRPDHLQQHIKNFHRTSLLGIVRDQWRKAGPGKNVDEGWTCGFCAQELPTWDIRETHIANHFKDGLKMDSWKEYPKSTPTTVKSNMTLQPREGHTPMLTRIRNRFSGHSNNQQEHQAVSHNSHQISFDPISPSTNFQDVQAAQTHAELSTIGFHNLQDPFMVDFDFSAANTANNIDSMCPTIDHSFDMYTQNQANQMDFNAINPDISNTDMFDNYIGIDFQGAWEQQPGQGQGQGQ